MRCVVESATTKTRVLEFECKEKLGVVDRLDFEEAGGGLDDENALGVASQGLEHDSPESLVASVSEGNSLLRFD